jgi:hypothetical protein
MHGCSPRVVGRHLAEQVLARVERDGLGYFPAVDYFRNDADMDPDLLEALDHIAWFVTGLVRDEVSRWLGPAFSRLQVETAQCTALTMPPVRRTQRNALDALARHYTPDTVKLALTADSVAREPHPDPQAVTRKARHEVSRWLGTRFEHLEVTNVTVL